MTAKKTAISAPENFQHMTSYTGSGSNLNLLGAVSATGSSAALSHPPEVGVNALTAEVRLALPSGHAGATHNSAKMLSPPPSPGFGTLASSSSLTLTTASGTTKASDASGKALLTSAAPADMGESTHSVTGYSGPVASYATAMAGSEVTSMAQTHATISEAQGSSKPFAFLSSAPSAFNHILKRMSKGDADSMKTNFLQV
ncbi:uncharacterized protein PHACADRAFT_254468 [Phanerochaete carnosa HHB-10118-sp]|uniref:Uncharacterized protein n=1 Tax=Phanerochaete carnosa (strain HHB-10118-sp) TaxID=650164 RepID=K5V361_PHACS|nr:uncharacterized protein PHACADRAFT_254468 [Phanerochaete carnosa HHB-10118-sp]EKM57006.1 hypothetical protein PHACADRAFT_254468 [Phanerochaete carnosa HHB-10118-sp]